MWMIVGNCGVSLSCSGDSWNCRGKTPEVSAHYRCKIRITQFINRRSQRKAYVSGATYDQSGWEEIQKKIEALPSFNPVARRIQRLLIGHATDLELDGSGRVLLPQPLREYAGLEKESVLVGQGKKLELWSKAQWESRRDDYLDMVSQPDQLPDELQSLSL